MDKSKHPSHLLPNKQSIHTGIPEGRESQDVLLSPQRYTHVKVVTDTRRSHTGDLEHASMERPLFVIVVPVSYQEFEELAIMSLGKY